MPDAELLLRRTYAAFNARDIEGALALMHDDVDWPNAMEGRRAVGRTAVRDYWTRQFAAIDSRVEPLRVAARDDGRLAVDVQQVVRDLDGRLLDHSIVTHVYTVRDGLVARMEIES